jgi:hypothetical protein
MNDDALATTVMQGVMPGDGVLPGLGRNSDRPDADSIGMGNVKQNKKKEGYVLFSLPAVIRQLNEEVVMSGPRCNKRR